jgi:hypothetical protein
MRIEWKSTFDLFFPAWKVPHDFYSGPAQMLCTGLVRWALRLLGGSGLRSYR